MKRQRGEGAERRAKGMAQASRCKRQKDSQTKCQVKEHSPQENSARKGGGLCWKSKRLKANCLGVRVLDKGSAASERWHKR